MDRDKIIQIFQTLEAYEFIEKDLNDLEHEFIDDSDVIELANYLHNNTKWEFIYIVNKQIILSRVEIAPPLLAKPF